MDCFRHVNPFRACAGLRGLGYFMVALVAAIVTVSYYAVVVYTWGSMLLAGSAAAVRRRSRSLLPFSLYEGVLFLLQLALILWCYLMVVFTDLVLYLKTGDMILKIVEILHRPLQRIKEVLLDIALAVKMANLHAAIIVLSVTDVC